MKRLCLKNGWNQEHVAKCLSVSIASYSKIETGVTDISLSRLEQIAGVFEISLTELLTGSDSEINEVVVLKDALLRKDAEIMALQKSLIELYKKLSP